MYVSLYEKLIVKWLTKKSVLSYISVKWNSKEGGHPFAVSLYNVSVFNLLNSTGHVMQQQFNIQQIYVLPTLYLYVLYLSENKQRHVPLTA